MFEFYIVTFATSTITNFHCFKLGYGLYNKARVAILVLDSNLDFSPTTFLLLPMVQSCSSINMPSCIDHIHLLIHLIYMFF